MQKKMTETLHNESLSRAGVVVHVVPSGKGGKPQWLVVGKTGWITEAAVRTCQTDRAVLEILEQVQSGRSFSTLNMLLWAWVAFSVFIYALLNAFVAVPVLIIGIVKITRFRRDA
ncbi:hypothetical protein HAP94_08295 [Acidithiobacillus ferrivorans]|nr:hypothetical protein [Acidithiobacillus ferrivorans]